jgi:hypothetical protein
MVAIWIAVLAFYASFAQASVSGRRVLIVPARYTVIKLAFDVTALRDIIMISYDKNEYGEPVMYRWDPISSKWERLTLDELEVGSYCLSTPSEIILVGNDQDLPSEIARAATQARKITRIKTLRIVDLVNGLDKSLKFSKGEWEALSRHNRFTIKDKNAEERRWGRYGPPKKYQTKHSARPAGVDAVAPVVSKKPERQVLVIDKQSAKAEDKSQLEKLEAELDNMLPEKAAKGVELKVPEAPKKEADEDTLDIPLDLPPATELAPKKEPAVDDFMPEDK